MCILDGKAYTALQEAGREQFEEDVEACIIAANNQGKELLSAGRNASHNKDKWVVVPLCRGQAHLPDLTVTGKLSRHSAVQVCAKPWCGERGGGGGI